MFDHRLSPYNGNRPMGIGRFPSADCTLFQWVRPLLSGIFHLRRHGQASQTPTDLQCLSRVPIEIVKPIFHQKSRSYWLSNVNEIDTNNMKSKWSICNANPTLAYLTQTIFHQLALGFALGAQEFALGLRGSCWGHGGFQIPTCWYLKYKMTNVRPQCGWVRVLVEYRLKPTHHAA